MGYLKKTWDSFINFILEVWMGFLLCLVIAVPAFFLGRLVPIIGGPVFAILAGMIVTLFIKDKSKLAGGITFTSKKILQYAVILLGFGLNLSVVLKTGAQSLPIIVSTIATSLLISYVLCKFMKIPSKISTLVGVGSSICGGSAVAATAPVIDASDEEVALAISVIFLFNIIAAVVFPSFGRLLGFSKTSGEAFGVFAGTAINDTSSVTAAASTWDAMFGLGSETLDKAVTVKLTRTLAIIPITLVLAFVRTRKAKKAIKMARAAKKAKELGSKAEKIEMENLEKKASSIVNIPPLTETDVVKVEPVVESSVGDAESIPVTSSTTTEEEAKKEDKKIAAEEDDEEKELESVDFMKIFPFFIIYFIIASVITTIATNLCGVSNSFFDPIKELSKFFIILAMSAVGINTNIVKLVKSGGKPIFMGLCCWVGITAVSLLMQKVLNLW